MNRRRVFQIVAVAAAVAAYLTIVVGGDLTATGSGMACGASWPFCPGGVIPPNLNNPSVAREFTHRVVAFTTSLLVLATLLLAVFWYRQERRILFPAATTFLLLVAQVLLGMATVQSDLSPDVVTAHLALGTATFASALVLAVVAFMPAAPKPAPDGVPS